MSNTVDDDYARNVNNEPALLIEPVVGYRTWKLRPVYETSATDLADTSPLVLTGALGNPWRTATLTATCRPPGFHFGGMQLGLHPGKPAPHPPCTCGIYGSYTPVVPQLAGGISFSGAIHATGRMHLGSKGFRAAEARIVALCIANNPLEDSLQAMSMWADQLRVAFDGMLRALGGVAPQPSRALPVRATDPARYRRMRRAALAKCPQYAGIPLYDSMKAMLADFPPPDLTALGVKKPGGIR